MADEWDSLAKKYGSVAKQTDTNQDPWAELNGRYAVEKSDSQPVAQSKPLKIGADAFPDILKQELQSANWLTRNIAGAGTALSNIYEGAKQFVGAGDANKIAANKIIEQEAPVGAFAGNAALTSIPFGMVGSGVRAAGAVGAGYGLMQPVQGEQTLSNIAQGKVINAGIGGITGAAGQAVANKAGDYIAGKAAQLAQEKSRNAPIDATIKEALDAGYVLPPGNVNPSFINRQLESMGGKIATQQMAGSRNQEVTDRLARKAAGLGESDPITPNTLSSVRTKLGSVYNDVGSIVGNDVVEALKVARADANQYWNMQMRNPHPETLKLARDATENAKNLEKTIDQVLTSVGKKDLMAKFRDARQKIAINHSVENALVEGGGTIDARTVARSAQRGDPLTGELATIGNFANNFPKVTQPDKAVGTPDAHNLKYMLSLAMGGGGAAAGDDPKYAALGILPLLSGPAARQYMFSKTSQNALRNNYALPLVTRMGGGLLNYAPVGATALGVPTLGK